MRVAELIEALQKLPPQARVCVEYQYETDHEFGGGLGVDEREVEEIEFLGPHALIKGFQ